MSPDLEVRALGGDDLEWVLALTRARRARLVPRATTFWRPATDAEARHREFLGSLLEEHSVLAVRNEHGYLVGLDCGDHLLVDDAVLTDEARWATDGVALLSHAAARGRLRFVVPAFETERLTAARAVSLEPVETWWHRDLEPSGTADGTVTALEVDGAVGRLVPAPPVYDPGGPVLLVSTFDSPAALARIERVAAAQGATVSVVSQQPDDEGLASLLTATGHVATTHFCEPPG